MKGTGFCAMTISADEINRTTTLKMWAWMLSLQLMM
jgi:hypothetical protein